MSSWPLSNSYSFCFTFYFYNFYTSSKHWFTIIVGSPIPVIEVEQNGRLSVLISDIENSEYWWSHVYFSGKLYIKLFVILLILILSSSDIKKYCTSKIKPFKILFDFFWEFFRYRSLLLLQFLNNFFLKCI